MAIDKNKIIEAATKYVQKGQYDKAIREYQKLLGVDVRDARVQQKLGELYQKKGDNALAAERFLKVAEIHSGDGFFLKAVAVYKQVLKLNPALVDVNLRLAELHQQLGLMGDAMAQYQLVANHYDKTGNTRASLDTLRKMVDLDPDNIASRIKLAELCAREQMNPEAVEEFRRAADYLKHNNRVDDYIKVAERLIFLDPGDLALTRELAGIYLAKQDTKRSLAKLQLCFKADPKDIETLTMLAQAFKDLGQISKTVSVYKELAKIFDQQERIDEERGTWRKILELAPDDREALAKISPAPAAARAFEGAPAAGPRAAPASQARAPQVRPSAEQIAKLLTETDVYVKYGLHEKAIEHLKRVFAADPNSIDAHEKAAALYLLTGNVASAGDSLARAVRLSMGRGDLDRARINVRKLYESVPDHPDAPEFLEAVGGLADAEEIAEIDDDAIIAVGSDEEVLDEPQIGPEGEQAFAAAGQDEGLLAAPLGDDDDDDVAIHVAADEADGVFASDDGDLLDGTAEPIPAGEDEPLSGVGPRDLPTGLSASSEADEPLLGQEPAEVVYQVEYEDIEDPEVLGEPLGEDDAQDRANHPTLKGPEEEVPATVPAPQTAEHHPRLAPVTSPALPVFDAGQPEADGESAREELEEAAFFLSQGSFEEAREILDTVRLAYPRSERARLLAEQLEAMERGTEVTAVTDIAAMGLAEVAPSNADDPWPPLAPIADEAFDLASELAKEDYGELGLQGASQDDFQYSVEDVFEEFKKGVQKVVKPEDVDTHYDLGIAYKEMGLIDDAIGEFEQARTAAAGKPKEVDCLTMVGMCHASHQQWPQAVEAFERALASAQTTAEQAKALRFEIALALEGEGRLAEALRYFQEVEQADPRFRDVRSIIERLGGARTAEGGDGADPSLFPSLGWPNGSRANGAGTSGEEPAPKGPADPKARKARKVGYV